MVLHAARSSVAFGNRSGRLASYTKHTHSHMGTWNVGVYSEAAIESNPKEPVVDRIVANARYAHGLASLPIHT